MQVLRIAQESNYRNGPYGYSNINGALTSAHPSFIGCEPNCEGRYGFKSLSWFLRWFDEEEREMMKGEGFALYIIEIEEEHVTHSADETQLIFDIEEMLSIGSIDIPLESTEEILEKGLDIPENTIYSNHVAQTA